MCGNFQTRRTLFDITVNERGNALKKSSPDGWVSIRCRMRGCELTLNGFLVLFFHLICYTSVLGVLSRSCISFYRYVLINRELFRRKGKLTATANLFTVNNVSTLPKNGYQPEISKTFSRVSLIYNLPFNLIILNYV